MRQLAILGASRGLGRALARGLPERGDGVFLVARHPPDDDPDDGVRRVWIRADLRATEAPRQIAAACGDAAIDVLVYNAGVWESGWTRSRFETADAAELRDILNVNLTGLVLCTQALLPHLRRSRQARVILIGSTAGLENEGTPLVAYAASKFGVRGAAHALREVLRPWRIGVTCLSPGTIATDVPLECGVAPVLERHGVERIPMGDIVELIRAILRLSPASCVKEIQLPALGDPRT